MMWKGKPVDELTLDEARVALRHCMTLLERSYASLAQWHELGGPSAQAACLTCGQPFGGRRSHSKFCSAKCKNDYHNQRKAEARAAP